MVLGGIFALERVNRIGERLDVAFARRWDRLEVRHELARQVLENLKTALASQKAGFSNVVKINIFTTDVEAFLGAAEIRAEYFKGNPPASTLVGISRLARPGLLVEIEAIAALP